jgi:hypothetical protein
MLFKIICSGSQPLQKYNINNNSWIILARGHIIFM